ncbi:MAG: hypothetical protein HZC54_23040 [Verrucomicrobia bacterium]|nr:hypothetical protein [Verrucomicrobiota bacterium]
MEPILAYAAEGRNPEKPMFSFHENRGFLWKLKDFVQENRFGVLATASRGLQKRLGVVKAAS